MNDLIAVPTVEQINLEHRLAKNKAGEAVQHATNCGLMLLQIKATKEHGEWLPWLNSEIESGRLTVGERQARRYMQVASNWTRESNLLEAPSIRAALELFSDKEPVEQQGELIDIEAERQALEAAEAKADAERLRREAAERVLLEAQQRAREFGNESNERRLKIRELETQIDLLKKAEPVIKAPDDYESAKQQAATLQAQTEALQTQLATLQKQQDKLINDQVKTKLQGYQDEVNEMEKKKKSIEDIVARKKAYLDSLDSEVKRVETHQEVINGSRLELIGLAAFLNDMEPMNDQATIRKWLALADMHEEAMNAIRLVFGQPRLELVA